MDGSVSVGWRRRQCHCSRLVAFPLIESMAPRECWSCRRPALTTRRISFFLCVCVCVWFSFSSLLLLFLSFSLVLFSCLFPSPFRRSPPPPTTNILVLLFFFTSPLISRAVAATNEEEASLNPFDASWLVTSPGTRFSLLPFGDFFPCFSLKLPFVFVFYHDEVLSRGNQKPATVNRADSFATAS